MKENRDIEKTYSVKEYAAKLRRFADALENDEKFEIQIAGERISVPERAKFSIEHERGDGMEEIEFQIKWKTEEAA
jgi:amphi-Trp domain-containing protein